MKSKIKYFPFNKMPLKNIVHFILLTRSGLNKMSDLVQDNLEYNFFYLDTNFTEICSWCPIDKESLLVQVMNWCQKGDKLLSKSMVSYDITRQINIIGIECWFTKLQDTFHFRCFAWYYIWAKLTFIFILLKEWYKALWIWHNSWF